MDNLVINLKDYSISDAKQFNDDLCKLYLLDNQDLSDTTIKGYKTYLKQFIIWLNKNQIGQPTEDTIKQYKLYLKDSNYTIATKNQYIRAVKHLFKWLNSRDLYKDVASNIREFKDSNKHKRDSLSIKEINKIVNDIDTSSEVGLRDRAIIILASTLGLRAKEIININISDIEQKDDIYIVSILGKGHNEKDTKKSIPKQVYQEIQDYLDSKKSYKSSDALFTSTSNRALNKRLTKESLSYIVKQRYIKSGFNSSKLTLHSLRHLTADATLKATDNNIYKTQHYLRHKNTATTEVYLSEQEDIDINLANDVYNIIFNTSDIDITKDLKVAINNLSASDKAKALDYIKTLNKAI